MASISVFGLGYVGAVLGACLADNNHTVIGVDVHPTKVDMINQGHSPVIETGLDELVRKGVYSGRFSACRDAQTAVSNTQVSYVCVGTPSRLNGSLDTTYVERVCKDIGHSLANKSEFHIVVIRSTLLPGMTEDLVVPALEGASGKKAGVDFGIGFNPEFLREGSSINDFYHPPYTIIGSMDDRVVSAVQEIYSMLDAPLLVVPIKVAEMVKFVNNAFHALKVTFANEVGTLCKHQSIDSRQVMEIFCQDHKLNLSPYYLMPGFAFGGSCLPKDLRALLYQSHQADAFLPVLEAVLPSNRAHIERAYQMIGQTGCKRVGVLGISFKDGTDDLRESPLVELIERLIGKGYQVTVYDRNVTLSQLSGANKAFIEQEIPHIARLMASSIDEVLNISDVIVLGNRTKTYPEIASRLRDEQVVIDLVHTSGGPSVSNGHYQGICW